MSTITAASGCTIAVGMDFPAELTRAERELIKEREAAYRKRQRHFAAVKRKRGIPDYMKPGPLTIIQLSR